LQLSPEKKTKLIEMCKWILAYVCVAILFSYLSLLHPQARIVLPDYQRPRLAIELSGHIIFGLIASIPLLNFRLISLTGLACVLIDLDHLTVALGFPVIGNPDHSIPFAILSGIVLALVGPRRMRRELFAIGFIVLFAHISFDVFAGWLSFQLLLPLNFAVFTLSTYYWLLLEVVAICISLMAAVSVKAKFRGLWD